jgi:hypothetical protein
MDSQNVFVHWNLNVSLSLKFFLSSYETNESVKCIAEMVKVIKAGRVRWLGQLYNEKARPLQEANIP